MKENRAVKQLISIALVLLALLLLWASYRTVERAVNQRFAPYNAALVKAGYAPLAGIDLFMPHQVNGKMYPEEFWRTTGKPCGSNCLAQIEAQAAKVGPLPVPWAAGGCLGLLLVGGLMGFSAFGPNPRRNMINLDRGKIRIRTREDSLPVVVAGGAQWGIMRRPDLKKSGRRQFGNGIFIGAPGKGKSNLLTSWLLLSDALNFIVIDLKGDLWRATAGHRSELGPVFRLDLSSLLGDALDPFEKEKKTDVVGLFEILLPTDVPGNTQHFNRAAQEIGKAYWEAARAAGIPSVPVLVQAATSSTADMLAQARELVELAPKHQRAAVLGAFKGAFSEVWDNPDKGSGSERGSTLSSFRAAFAALNTPEIVSTLAARTFDPAELVEGRGTLYITAPSTEAPYKAPLEMLLGAVIEEIFAYCDQHGAGEEIVVLADEAGALKIPRFNTMLSTGRGRNVTVTAFLQDLGQLRQYHQDGWRGITDTIHHWTFWNTKNPDARDFLRDACGVFDQPNPSRDAEERKRRPYLEVDGFDDLAPSWREEDVISLLDYDRGYVVHGRAVTPFKGPAKARRDLPPPKLPRLTFTSRLLGDSAKDSKDSGRKEHSNRSSTTSTNVLSFRKPSHPTPTTSSEASNSIEEEF